VGGASSRSSDRTRSTSRSSPFAGASACAPRDPTGSWGAATTSRARSSGC
jgi:hypothetical protein